MVDYMEELNKVYSFPLSTTCYQKHWVVPGFFLSRNLQSVWYEREDDRSHALDENVKRSVHYDIPDELANLFSFRNNSLSEDMHNISLRYIYIAGLTLLGGIV